MAHPGRQEILVVAGVAQQEHADVIDQIGVRADVEIEIAAHAAAGIDPDRAGDGLGRMARLLHRGPGDLEKLAVLRIEDGGILGGEAEELGIEGLEPVHGGGGGHVILAPDLFG